MILKKIALLIVLILPRMAITDDSVYEWSDDRGVRYFSNKKDANPKARIADLPEIQHLSFPEAPVAEPCSAHGGVDCSKGQDSDGSVICVDGYKKALARFIFLCSAAKLSLEEVLQKDGKSVVIVRNSASIASKGTKVTLRDQTAEGPESVEAHSIGEFVLPVPEINNKSEVVVACTNCN
jgi:hypothetical protein